MKTAFRFARCAVRSGVAALTVGLIALPAIGSIHLAAAVPGVHAQTQSSGMYSTQADPKAEIHDALITAGMQHKRVLVIFGFNSCHTCQLLHTYLQDPRNFRVVKNHYVVVHVNVGPNLNQNLDIVHHYNVPLKKGVPVVAVLERPGRAVYVQRDGEFGKAHGLSSDSVYTFLQTWRQHSGPAQATQSRP